MPRKNTEQQNALIATGGAAPAPAKTVRRKPPVARARNKAVEAASPFAFDPEIHHEEISSLAYRFWQERGCPQGSSDQDWFRAVAEVRGRHASSNN